MAKDQHKYTAQEDAWLRENYEKYTHPELVRLFNERFGTSMKSGVTDHVLKTLHLHKKVNRGDCRKGERRCTNTLPVGAESFDGFNVYVKISNEVNDCQNRRMPSKRYDKNWMRKDYIVWQEHGLVPPQDPSEMLIHLNGDKKDCSFKNLYKTTRAINFMMAKNGWYSEDREVTLAGLKWCELFYAMKEKVTGNDTGRSDGIQKECSV
jgi:hypothetical protein